MKIIQITASPFEGGVDIFGLGDDGQVYYWDNRTAVWILDSTKDK